MKVKNSIVSSITGGVSSAIPVLFACCKGGACLSICVAPIASLFGISSATMLASPIMGFVEPLLIAISAVSFTISYYSLYVLPKTMCNTGASCDRNSSHEGVRKQKAAKAVFWFGLILSIGFFSYFEHSKYQNSRETAASSSCSPESGCGAGAASSCAEE